MAVKAYVGIRKKTNTEIECFVKEPVGFVEPTGTKPQYRIWLEFRKLDGTQLSSQPPEYFDINGTVGSLDVTGFECDDHFIKCTYFERIDTAGTGVAFECEINLNYRTVGNYPQDWIDNGDPLYWLEFLQDEDKDGIITAEDLKKEKFIGTDSKPRQIINTTKTLEDGGSRNLALVFHYPKYLSRYTLIIFNKNLNNRTFDSLKFYNIRRLISNYRQYKKYQIIPKSEIDTQGDYVLNSVDNPDNLPGDDCEILTNSYKVASIGNSSYSSYPALDFNIEIVDYFFKLDDSYLSKITLSGYIPYKTDYFNQSKNFDEGLSKHPGYYPLAPRTKLVRIEELYHEKFQASLEFIFSNIKTDTPKMDRYKIYEKNLLDVYNKRTDKNSNYNYSPYYKKEEIFSKSAFTLLQTSKYNSLTDLYKSDFLGISGLFDYSGLYTDYSGLVDSDFIDSDKKYMYFNCPFERTSVINHEFFRNKLKNEGVTFYITVSERTSLYTLHQNIEFKSWELKYKLEDSNYTLQNLPLGVDYLEKEGVFRMNVSGINLKEKVYALTLVYKFNNSDFYSNRRDSVIFLRPTEYYKLYKKDFTEPLTINLKDQIQEYLTENDKGKEIEFILDGPDDLKNVSSQRICNLLMSINDKPTKIMYNGALEIKEDIFNIVTNNKKAAFTADEKSIISKWYIQKKLPYIIKLPSDYLLNNNEIKIEARLLFANGKTNKKATKTITFRKPNGGEPATVFIEEEDINNPGTIDSIYTIKTQKVNTRFYFYKNKVEVDKDILVITDKSDDLTNPVITEVPITQEIWDKGYYKVERVVVPVDSKITYENFFKNNAATSDVKSKSATIKEITPIPPEVKQYYKGEKPKEPSYNEIDADYIIDSKTLAPLKYIKICVPQLTFAKDINANAIKNNELWIKRGRITFTEDSIILGNGKSYTKYGNINQKVLSMYKSEFETIKGV